MWSRRSGEFRAGVGQQKGRTEPLTNNQNDADIRILDNIGADGVDVSLVLGNTAVGDGELSIGGSRGAVPVGKVIDDEDTGVGRVGTGIVGGADVGESGFHLGDLGLGIHPHEGRNLGDGRGLGNERTRERRDGEVVDLGGVVGVGPHLDTRERVALPGGGAGAYGGLRGGGSGSRGDPGRRSLDRALGARGSAGGGGLGSLRVGETLEIPVVLLNAGVAGSAASSARPADTATLAPREVC